MKIILVATGDKGQNVVFVTDTLNVYPLAEAVRLAKKKKFRNVHAVQTGSGTYLRSSRNVPKKAQLEQLSISSHELFDFVSGINHAASTPAFSRYLQLFEYSLRKNGGPLIVIEGKGKITKEEARAKLVQNKSYVFDAAKKFDVDPYLLGAILIDEIAQLKPLEDIGEALLVFFVGKNASGGVAQVKVETARGLIQNEYYNPDPTDPRLSSAKIKKTPRPYLFQYVKKPEHSIFFAAARMRELTDKWKDFADLSGRPEIIATLYHLPKRHPHAEPKTNPRGLQIAREFYELATLWLK